MPKEHYPSDLETGSETDDSDDESIEHADFYQYKRQTITNNPEVKLTLMQRARKRPGIFTLIIFGFLILIATITFLIMTIMNQYNQETLKKD